jgi:hypothetical protein
LGNRRYREGIRRHQRDDHFSYLTKQRALLHMMSCEHCYRHCWCFINFTSHFFSSTHRLCSLVCLIEMDRYAYIGARFKVSSIIRERKRTALHKQWVKWKCLHKVVVREKCEHVPVILLEPLSHEWHQWNTQSSWKDINTLITRTFLVWVKVSEGEIPKRPRPFLWQLGEFWKEALGLDVTCWVRPKNQLQYISDRFLGEPVPEKNRIKTSDNLFLFITLKVAINSVSVTNKK